MREWGLSQQTRKTVRRCTSQIISTNGKPLAQEEVKECISKNGETMRVRQVNLEQEDGERDRQVGPQKEKSSKDRLYSVDCWTAATSSTSDTEKISEGGLGKMEKIMVLIDSPQSLHNKEH